ncbi:MAG TPA: hypothetical protein P5087_06215 [Eubacteriales bacterium]|nr:hypothetical protein [Eubacteriales bacterium]
MDDKNDFEKIKKIADYYGEKGESQLVKDIFSSVVKQKTDGSLSNEQLKAFAKQLSPLLNEEQRGRLNELIKQLLDL